MATKATTPKKYVLGKGLASLLPSNEPEVDAVPIENVDHEPQITSGAVSAKKEPAQAPTPATEPILNKDRHPGISLCEINRIKANPNQPRRDFDETELKELSQSIEKNGIIQPLVVRKVGADYELIAGERRLRASKLAGLQQVPIVIRKSTDKESL